MTMIRPYVPADVAAIKRLLAQLQAVEAALQPARKSAPAVAAEEIWGETQRLLDEGKAEVFVAEDSGAIVGVGIGYENRSGDLSLTIEARRSGYVSDLVVDSSRRGQGIGRALLAALLERFRHRGLKIGRIGAITENVDAIRLYQDVGFKPVSVALEITL